MSVSQRLTHVRYADDIIVYAKTADELIFMMNALVDELNKIGLHLSPLKTKILTTVDVGAQLYLDIASSMLEVLMHSDVHKYLGRQISDLNDMSLSCVTGFVWHGTNFNGTAKCSPTSTYPSSFA